MTDEELAPTAPAAPEQPAWLTNVLRQRLSTVQAIVGILAGVLTIGGGFLSVTGITSAASRSAAAHGELVMLVQDARTHKPVMLSTVEIFTPQDALVTTLTVEGDGRLVRRLKEGQYRLRVLHPAFSPEVRRVEVHMGQRSEVRIPLVVRPVPSRPAVVRKDAPAPAPVPVPVPVIEAPPGQVQKFFKDLFITETLAP
jgi:hypothetical protein